MSAAAGGPRGGHRGNAGGRGSAVVGPTWKDRRPRGAGAAAGSAAFAGLDEQPIEGASSLAYGSSAHGRICQQSGSHPERHERQPERDAGTAGHATRARSRLARSRLAINRALNDDKSSSQAASSRSL